MSTQHDPTADASLPGPASLPAAGSSRPWALARHSLGMAGRSLTKTRRNPGLVLDALMLPILFLLLFVYLIGGAVAGSTQEYLQYIFPGILVFSAIMVGQTSTGLNLVLDMKKGVFDRFRSMPIGRSAPLLGSVLGDSVRYVVAVVALFALGLLLGFRVQTDLPSALAAVALAILLGFALSWLPVLLAALLRDETLVTTVGFLLPFPLVFGTSMVAPVETMPGWLQAWSEVNPVGHAIDAGRGLLLGGPVAEPVLWTLVWSAVFLVVLVPLAVLAYRRQT